MHDLKRRLTACIDAAEWAGTRDQDTLREALETIESLQAKVAELESRTPVVVFEGYIDGMPVIKWIGEHLPAGTRLCAIPERE